MWNWKTQEFCVEVFDCCFSKNVLKEEEYKVYIRGIVAQLQDHYPDASFMVFNFREGRRRSRISDIMSQYEMTVMEYPRQYEGCPLLPLEMIHHFLRSSESWLSLEGQQNVLLMHCERGGWPVLAFMLAGLLLYRKQYNGEYKTLEMVYKQAPRELLQLLSPLNPQPSHLRYLHYISKRHLSSKWPPSEIPLYLDCLILRVLPLFDGGKGCRPVVRVYGPDPSEPVNRSTKLLFSTSMTQNHVHHYQQAECMLVKVDIHCNVQGDVVLECIHLSEDFVREQIMFRVMFHTSFVQSNMLMLSRDEIDILWDAKDQFPKDFKFEVLFLDTDAIIPKSTVDASEDANYTDCASPEAEEFYEAEEIFSSVTDDQMLQLHSPPSPPPYFGKNKGSFVTPSTHWKSVSSIAIVGQNDGALPPSSPAPPNESSEIISKVSELLDADSLPCPSPSLPPPPPPPPLPPKYGVTSIPPPSLSSTNEAPLPPPSISSTSFKASPPLSKSQSLPSLPLSTASPPPPSPPLCKVPPPPPPLPPLSGTPPPPQPPLLSRAPPPPTCGPSPPPMPGGPPQIGSRAPTPPPSGTDPKGRFRGLARPMGAGAMTTRRSSLKPLHWSKVTRALQGSIWDELQRRGESQITQEFDVSEIEKLFSANVSKLADSDGKSGRRCKSLGSKTDKIHLIDLRRANNTEIMLTKVKMPLPEMMAAVVAMDDSVLDVDQVENLIKFCPTKEEMELLKGYTGDKENLGNCEKYFLELMKVPRVESKLRVFSFKIQFATQITEFKKNLHTVHSACEEVRNSFKLKEIMKKILYLGNTLNQGTARGSAVGFKLDSLLKLTETRASNSKMTLMHFLCKVLAERFLGLLDFHLDLVSLEAATKIQLKSLAEEMQAIIKGLEKVKQELAASENDGPVSEDFHKTLKEFITDAESEVVSVTNLYSVVGRNADALAQYFGEDPARCPFEQVTATLLNFTRLFRKAHEENCKQAELDKRKAEKEGEMEKAKGINLTRKSGKIEEEI